jgi:hypothetical protein
LKLAKIIPLFKAGCQNCVNNYRPIALLSVFDKILEKLMYKRLISYFENKNILFKFDQMITKYLRLASVLTRINIQRKGCQMFILSTPFVRSQWVSSSMDYMLYTMFITVLYYRHIL